MTPQNEKTEIIPLPRKILVTGGAGFIGSALIRYLLAQTNCEVINLDALTYAASPATLDQLDIHDRHHFEKADIQDAGAVRDILNRHRPDGIIHLAAESHVDRSIDESLPFIRTNVLGTCILLDEARGYWDSLPAARKDAFRFLHVSTDEVYGSLGDTGAFTETTPYAPNSPYAASKASADHMVRAWSHTYGLPIVISNCSNNYGPYQFPEKLIPLMIIKAMQGEDLSVYGRGENVRDWLHVDDHARALWLIFTKGQAGECYNVGGDSEHRNIDVVRKVCHILDEIEPDAKGGPRERLITYVDDRPGHDFRYAIDATKLKTGLGWAPEVGFDVGLRQTISWYQENQDWWRDIQKAQYKGQRLGLKGIGR